MQQSTPCDPTQLAQANGAVSDLIHYAETGQSALAEQARRTLDTIASQYDEETGRFAYPESIRARLRAAGLREAP